MPTLYDYRIFISHAWRYGDEYNRLVSLLNSSPWFSYYNYSAPKEKPLHFPAPTHLPMKSRRLLPPKSKEHRSSLLSVVCIRSITTG